MRFVQPLNVCVLAMSVSLGCVGPLFFNLAPEKELPPSIEYKDYTIVTRKPDSAARFYWTSTPTWGEPSISANEREARANGYWRQRASTNEPAVYMKKVNGTCFWEPIRVMQTVRLPNTEFYDNVEVLLSTSGDQFSLPCEFFDGIPSVARVEE